MFTTVYFKKSYDDGITYEARPMPEKFVGTHFISSNGTPIRVYILDKNEKRKFVDRTDKLGVFLSEEGEEGEEGYIGYHDYYIENDESVTSQVIYVHPLHRKRGLAKRLMECLAEHLTEGSVFNEHTISSPFIASEVDKINLNGKVTVKYKVPKLTEESA